MTIVKIFNIWSPTTEASPGDTKYSTILAPSFLKSMQEPGFGLKAVHSGEDNLLFLEAMGHRAIAS